MVQYFLKQDKKYIPNSKKKFLKEMNLDPKM